MLAAAGAEIVGRSQPEAGAWGKGYWALVDGWRREEEYECMVVNPPLHTLLSFPLQLLFSAEEKSLPVFSDFFCRVVRTRKDLNRSTKNVQNLPPALRQPRCPSLQKRYQTRRMRARECRVGREGRRKPPRLAFRGFGKDGAEEERKSFCPLILIPDSSHSHSLCLPPHLNARLGNLTRQLSRFLSALTTQSWS